MLRGDKKKPEKPGGTSPVIIVSGVMGRSVEVDELVFLRTKTYLFGVVECVHAVARIDTLDEMNFAVILG